MLASLVIFIANDVFFATIAHLLNHHYHFVQGERKDYLTTAVSVTFAFCLLTLPYYFFRIASWTIFSGTIVALAAFVLQRRGNFLAIVTTSFFTALHGSYYNMLITNYELVGVLVALALDILHNTFLYDMTQDFVENYLIKLLEQDNLARNPVVEEDTQLSQSVKEAAEAVEYKVDNFVEQVNALHNDSESESESEEDNPQ